MSPALLIVILVGLGLLVSVGAVMLFRTVQRKDEAPLGSGLEVDLDEDQYAEAGVVEERHAGGELRGQLFRGTARARDDVQGAALAQEVAELAQRLRIQIDELVAAPLSERLRQLAGVDPIIALGHQE